ncbi:type I restriction endonuclease [uncultured Bacteroides sp.]|uniref:type I restriction endonuclease n=1 Tax=uncultured Bacteroides sp. TaxID=162156 RepID=UPI00262B5CEB|nr:type I restriction endonuclease [uncultured Bacteroides sp.]
MDFKDYCKQLADRVQNLKEQILTEEATKNAFIMPFIQMLGYDVFNPLEVIPEMDCDLVRKKGEKIDYAIMKDGEPIMLIECKHWKQDLNLHDNQLQKYFVASKAKFGVLTNGITYRFYTDLSQQNLMDDTPFLEINLENLKDNQVEELKKFHKSYFNLETILSTANELKYMSALKAEIKTEFNSPSPELVKVLSKRVYDGVMTQKVLEQFTEHVKRALSNYVNEVISERLNVAIKSTEQTSTSETVEECNEIVEPVSKIITTEEELEAFYIIKSILRNTINSDRITYRDAQSYFAVFIDDNNRKPVCRLYFNKTSNSIGIFDADKNESKFKIENLDEIYNYQSELINSIQKYL